MSLTHGTFHCTVLGEFKAAPPAAPPAPVAPVDESLGELKAQSDLLIPRRLRWRETAVVQ